MTWEVEVAKKFAVSILSDIYAYMLKHSFYIEEQHNPISKITLGLSAKIITEIYKLLTFEQAVLKKKQNNVIF